MNQIFWTNDHHTQLAWLFDMRPMLKSWNTPMSCPLKDISLFYDRLCGLGWPVFPKRAVVETKCLWGKYLANISYQWFLCFFQVRASALFLQMGMEIVTLSGTLSPSAKTNNIPDAWGDLPYLSFCFCTASFSFMHGYNLIFITL